MSTQQKSSPKTPHKQPHKVLIIDDDAFFRKLLADMVSGIEGFNVVGEAEDGVEGIKKAKELAPEIVFLDVVMPLKNGIETAWELSRSANPPQIIICSTMKGEAVIKDAKAMGVCAYINKPPQKEEVVEILKTLATF